MKNPNVPSVVEVQHQIRANASQLQDYFSDLYAWEESISKENSVRKKALKTATNLPAAQAVPAPRKANVESRCNKSNGTVKTNTPDARTYDNGHKRCENNVVDVLLSDSGKKVSLQHCNESPGAMQSLPRQVATTRKSSASVTTTKSREELEKVDGNAHYKQGDYVAAIKSYTRCLGYNPHNVVVLSNRAMACLKNREFANAEDDCTMALKTDPTHVKSYLRRGTARNALGKHRLALLDFQRAAKLDPNSRQTQTQLQSTREHIRMAIKRSSKRTEFAIGICGTNTKQTSPEDDSDAGNTENIRLQQPKASPDTDAFHMQNFRSFSQLRAPMTAMSVEERSEKTKSSSAIIPKLPQKAPGTSYEFGRVWKTLALRGDAELKSRLLSLRADYLRKIEPSTLSTVFKTGVESDVLCEIFCTLRYAILVGKEEDTIPKESVQFALALANELTKVPRFKMTILLLSSCEREDIKWVIKRLAALVKKDNGSIVQDMANFFELYELP